MFLDKKKPQLHAVYLEKNKKPLCFMRKQHLKFIACCCFVFVCL